MNRFLLTGLKLTLMLLVLPAASLSAAEDTAKLKHFHHNFAPLEVEGTEIPMFGKWNDNQINIGDTAKPHKIWVKEVHTQVVDEASGAKLPDYLCHSHLGENGTDAYESMKVFGNHGGAADTVLPDGFAVPLTVSPKHPALFYAMVADYAKRGLKKKVHVEMDLAYYDNEDAKKLKIKPLEIREVFAKGKNGLGGSMPELMAKEMHSMHMAGMHMDMHQRTNVPVGKGKVDWKKYDNIHWFAPPGKTEVRTPLNDQLTDLQKGDIRIHHIHAHTHPYATLYQLYDATDKKVVHEGKIETFSDRTVVKSVDHYSSSEGMLLKKNHNYEMVVVYDNPKDKPVTAMLTWRVFYRPVR